MYSRILGREGFTITSALVGLGITGIAVITLSQSFLMLQRQGGWVDDHREVNSVINQAEVLLQNNGACGSSFQNLNPRGTGQTTRLGGLVGPSGNILTLDDIRMQNFIPDAPNATEGWADILFSFSRNTNSAPGGRKINRTVSNVRVALNGPANRGGMVQTCQSQSSTLADLCTSLGGNYDPTSASPCKLTQDITEQPLPLSPNEQNGYGMHVSHLECPNNYGVVGMRGRSGAAIDRFAIACQEIDYSVNPPIPTGPVFWTMHVGANGGSPFGPTMCPANKWAIALGGKANGAGTITLIQLQCANFDHTGPVTTIHTPIDTRWGGTAFNYPCDKERVLRRVSTRFSNYMSGITGACI